MYSRAESEAGGGREAEERKCCDYCGVQLSAMARSERRKYCSEICQKKASRGRMNYRLAQPVSKRYSARLKFSNPLYFD